MLPHRRLILPVLALVGSLAMAAPASARVTGTTSTDDVVLDQHCQQHPIAYDLHVEPLTGPWRLEVQVFDPGGHTSQGTVLNSASNPPLAGTITFTFCGSEPVGTYTVRSTVRYSPADLDSTTLPDTTFAVRPPATTARLRHRDLGPRGHRLVARVREQAERGSVRADGVRLRLERRAGSGWRPVPGVVLTTARGRAATTITGRGVYRVVVPARRGLAASASRSVSLR